MTNLEMLSEIKDTFIQFANTNGINLAEHFKSQEEFKDFIIGLTFKNLVDAGVSVEKATDMTLGENAYQDIFDTVNALA